MKSKLFFIVFVISTFLILLSGCGSAQPEKKSINPIEEETSHFSVSEDGSLQFSLNYNAPDVKKMLELTDNGKKITNIGGSKLEDFDTSKDGGIGSARFNILKNFSGQPNSFYREKDKFLDIRYNYFSQEHKRTFTSIVRFKRIE